MSQEVKQNDSFWIMKAIGCSDKKVNRMLRELEVVAGLIERKRQGLGKPNLIYVKNFLSVGQNGRSFTKLPEQVKMQLGV